MNKKSFWDNRAKDYSIKDEKYNIKFNYYIKNLYERITDRIKSSGINKILKTDLWDCVLEDRRNMYLCLKKKFSDTNLYGVDISEDLVEKATRKYGNNFFQTDLTKNDKFEKKVDLITDYSTLDHIPVEKLDNVINYYYNSLNDNGYIILIYYRKNLFFSILSFIRNIVLGKSLYDVAEEGGQYYFNDKDINKIINEKNLHIEEKYYLNSLSSFPKTIFRNLPDFFIESIMKLEISKISFLFYFNANMKGLILKK